MLMAAYDACRQTSTPCPAHPGTLIKCIIPGTGKSKVEIADMLGVSRQHLHDIIRERKPVSPNVAARLGKLFGDGAGRWLRMQADYDAWQAKNSAELASVPTLEFA